MTVTRAARSRATATATAPVEELLVIEHVSGLGPVLGALSEQAGHLGQWGRELAARSVAGARLLAAGNGGSAAEAQHLTAELVGRFDEDRPAFSAIALHAETSSLTAIGNDYGYDQVFARQVSAHGRVGDILLLLSTSGASRNLVCAAEAARNGGLTSWALTGAGPNPLTLACDDHIALPGAAAHVQEAQLVALHAICRVFDAELAARRGTDRTRALRPGGSA